MLLFYSQFSCHLASETDIVVRSTWQSKETKTMAFWPDDQKRESIPKGQNILGEISKKRELPQENNPMEYELQGSSMHYACVDLTLNSRRWLSAEPNRLTACYNIIITIINNSELKLDPGSCNTIHKMSRIQFNIY